MKWGLIFVMMLLFLASCKSTQLEAIEESDLEEAVEPVDTSDSMEDFEEINDSEDLETDEPGNETDEEDSTIEEDDSDEADSEELEELTNPDTCNEDEFGVVRFFDDDGEKHVYRNECLRAQGYPDYIVDYNCKPSGQVGSDEKKCSKGCDDSDRRYGAECN